MSYLLKIIVVMLLPIFDLWMSKGAHDVFVLMINFLGSDWKPKHVTLGLFEVTKTIG
jgi:hypothetical protein